MKAGGQSKQADRGLKVALVCDWLTTPGGAEKVLLELHRMYPEAPIYTSQYRKKGINWFDDAEVKTGWLQIFPAGLRRFLGPLRQIYFSCLDLSEYDLVISVTGAEAKAVRTRSSERQAFHLCYCHVPTQYYWQMYDKYVENPGFGILDPLVRLCFKLLVRPLRQADYRAAQRPDQFVTISGYAKDQIKRYYSREALVVAPPVEIEKFRLDARENEKGAAASAQVFHSEARVIHNKAAEIHKKSTGEDDLSTKLDEFSTGETETNEIEPYFIIASRQVTWKRADLAIKACIETNHKLKVVGKGPEHGNLARLAKGHANIEIIPWVQGNELAKLLQNAKGYIFPSLEPFGIAAVEALAAGCPVIAYRDGGSRDFIKEKVNGVFFDHQTVNSLARALKTFDQQEFDKTQVSQSADKFSVAHFRQRIKDIVKLRGRRS